MEDQEIFLKVLGKKICNDFGQLVMALVKLCWLHFLGLTNSRMLDLVVEISVYDTFMLKRQYLVLTFFGKALTHITHLNHP